MQCWFKSELCLYHSTVSKKSFADVLPYSITVGIKMAVKGM
jgi:hypothetical protein